MEGCDSGGLHEKGTGLQRGQVSDNQLSSSDSKGLTAAARMNVIQLRRSRLVKLSLFAAAGLLFVYIVVRSSSTSTPHGKPN